MTSICHLLPLTDGVLPLDPCANERSAQRARDEADFAVHVDTPANVVHVYPHD